ncbi:MAG TPA: hypothetical protein VGD30_04110 [Telluria sp.]
MMVLICTGRRSRLGFVRLAQGHRDRGKSLERERDQQHPDEKYLQGFHWPEV